MDRRTTGELIEKRNRKPSLHRGALTLGSYALASGPWVRFSSTSKARNIR
jgi:hypothetical protein